MTEPGARPLVHVFVPTYGRPEYLDATLASTRAAAERDWPVTAFDDATPDDSLVSIVAAHPHVDYVGHVDHVGVAANFNACAQSSRGEYTVLLGSDDLLEPAFPEVVDSLIRRFDRPELVQPGARVIDETGRPTLPLADRVKRIIAPHAPPDGRTYTGDAFTARLLLGDWLYFPAIAWRTDVLRATPFDPAYQSAMDLDVLLRLGFAGARLAYDPRVAFAYRRHAASVSSALAHTGVRYGEETRISEEAAGRARALGWRRTLLAARTRPTVRAHHALNVVRARVRGA